MNNYRLKLCSTSHKHARHYATEAHKQGYLPYRYIDEFLMEEFFCINVLEHEDYYRSSDMKFKSYGGVTTWNFKK